MAGTKNKNQMHDQQWRTRVNRLILWQELVRIEQISRKISNVSLWWQKENQYCISPTEYSQRTTSIQTTDRSARQPRWITELQPKNKVFANAWIYNLDDWDLYTNEWKSINVNVTWVLVTVDVQLANVTLGWSKQKNILQTWNRGKPTNLIISTVVDESITREHRG